MADARRIRPVLWVVFGAAGVLVGLGVGMSAVAAATRVGDVAGVPVTPFLGHSPGMLVLRRKVGLLGSVRSARDHPEGEPTSTRASLVLPPPGTAGGSGPDDSGAVPAAAVHKGWVR